MPIKKLSNNFAHRYDFEGSKIVIMGPPPGSNGGIGVMMSYLAQTSSVHTTISFTNSGSAGPTKLGRLLMFLKAIAQVTIARQGTTYHVNLASKGSATRKWVLTALMRIRKHPYVLHLHGGGFENFYESLDSVRAFLVRKMFHRADGVAVLGTVWQRFAEGRLNVPPSKVFVLPNAVPGPSVVPVREGPIKVLFTGRIGKRKGALDLLLAWKNVNYGQSSELVLAGKVEDEAGVAEALRTSKNTRVTGWLDQASLCEELAKASIIVLPSHVENFPLSLLEGAAWGLAPISTAVGAIPDIITNGQNGLIVEPENSCDLAHALQTLLEDQALRQNFGKNFRLIWEKNYNIQMYRQKFDAMHLELAKRRT